MRLLKRILKILALSVISIVAVVALVILCGWGYYRSVVGKTPGALPLPVALAPLGAEVNLFSGTGGVSWMCGHNTPAATTPFGMVRLGPDTAAIFTDKTANNRSGYFYGDNKIIGFSHTRLVGADAQDGGVFRVFPSRESFAEQDSRGDRAVAFSHARESAAPGYYAVVLDARDVKAELTATPRVGVHRYTFDASDGDAPRLLIDIGSSIGGKRTEDALAIIEPAAGAIRGHVKLFGSFSGRYDGLDVYFAAKVDKPITSFGLWDAGGYHGEKREGGGPPCVVDLGFSEGTVELRVALSYVSMANAQLNLEAEAPPGQSFEQIAGAARDQWEEHLSRIRIEGGTSAQRRIFYTALYRAFQMPTIFCDVNGDYMGFDKAVHRADGFTYYTDFSMWDTCRTTQPLYYLIARAEARDMMVSLVEMAKAGGYLPRWPSGAGYTNSMLGTPADIAVSEAYQKGIRDFDVDTAYQAMRKTALGKPEGSRFSGREGIEQYLALGYCPHDEMKESVACTLEFACEDNAIAKLAEALGHADDAKLFATHAQHYRNVWNADRQFFEGRNADGAFPVEFEPTKLTYLDPNGPYTKAYVEGSAWQWRWFVPHDAEGLVSLFSSPEYFVGELDTFFEETNSTVGFPFPGGYYWHGNEPDLHSVYLFNAAGRPDLTQKWVRHLLETKYSDDYVGLDGNDDGGTLSAWYVLSALGFYPVPGTARYELGAPLFTRAVVDIGDGQLVVEAPANGPDNFYVHAVAMNGESINRTWFSHDEIAGGATLTFTMGPEPQL